MGHAVFGDNGLVIFDGPAVWRSERGFRIGQVGRQGTGRQRLSRYVLERMVPELNSAIMSIEAARAHLRDGHHPFDAELEKVTQSLTGLLQASRAEFLQHPERPVTIESA
jgi:hypothetical protein